MYLQSILKQVDIKSLSINGTTVSISMLISTAHMIKTGVVKYHTNLLKFYLTQNTVHLLIFYLFIVSLLAL